MSPGEIAALLHSAFSEWDKTGITIEAAGYCSCRLRMAVDNRSARPGGTVSGPTMFMLADTALYVAVLASIGPQALAVTTNMSINFLRKPELKDLIAECSLLKLGSRIAVGEVAIFSEAGTDPVAHATGSYSIPPR